MNYGVDDMITDRTGDLAFISNYFHMYSFCVSLYPPDAVSSILSSIQMKRMEEIT